MKRKSKLIIGGVVLLLILVAVRQMVLLDSNPGSAVDPDGTVKNGDAGNSGASSSLEGSGGTGLSAQASGTGENMPTVQVPDLKILQLQALLDDDSNRKKTLTMAVAMTNGTVPQQLAAIEAFRWLGGRDAIKSLIGLRNEAYPEVAEQAGQVLAHLLATGLYAENLSEVLTVRDPDPDNVPEDTEGAEETSGTDDEEEETELPLVAVFDAELWEKAIREAPSELDRDELLILLSAYPGTKSVPVLLNMLESETPELREHALEYLEFVTYGEKITTRQQGEDWLATHGAMEEYTP